ncbi:hypothetical protein CAPN010_05000 [Capnocytophaga cynodegmi]|uniref:hypothetical protein n=1 Tax=Capnocytophaga TaxID=1016 RepID=UPI001951219C|nr:MULTISPECIES: hypothetical protein [Capnocytophaga]GIJ96405.1 hypothetical protein CAPN001_09740 [Capnocytophaga stomatis]GJQ06342.1 hypothetical protein CAPN010_05000 [Capnocytophaga cynodegmi]
MRESFCDNSGKRLRFKAKFVRYGEKSNRYSFLPLTTLLFVEVESLDGEIKEDHIWLNLTKEFEKLEANLKEGVIVEFDARIKLYKKGYINRRLDIYDLKYDYKLSHPTRVKIVDDELKTS